MRITEGNIVQDLQRWQESYLETRRAENLAQRSLTIYREVLDELVEFSRGYLGEIGIVDINLLFVTLFFKDKDSRGVKPYSASTKRQYLTIIRTFFKYVSENNTDGVDLLYNIRNMKIKVECKEKPFVSSDEITKILNYLTAAILSGKREFSAYRNALIFKLLYYTGIRVQELIKMRLCDLVYDSQEEVYRILVEGKGSKERFVYIDVNVIENELEYLVNRLGPDSFIAITSKGMIMTGPHVYQALERVYRGSGSTKRGLHILRHTFGRRMVDEDVNMETIRDTMGHASIVTTQGYARTNEKNKIRAMTNGKG